MKQHLGFTLIELLIAVAIAGILAAIAIPSYKEFVIKGKIQDATSGLSDYKMKMEQFYQNNRTYQDTSNACGSLATTKTSDYFTFSCVASDSEHYTITATNRSGKGLDDGYTYTINESSGKTSNYAGTVNNSCWLINKSSC